MCLATNEYEINMHTQFEHFPFDFFALLFDDKSVMIYDADV